MPGGATPPPLGLISLRCAGYCASITARRGRHPPAAASASSPVPPPSRQSAAAQRR
ncbi:hypothetical protein KCP77_01970 [Salmonella enterica subsp. enterica]|nr:hypothetical protein KCP77_01970 [Salmonella enterica subsp. enterica]